MAVDNLVSARENLLNDWDGQNRQDYIREARGQLTQLLQDLQRVHIREIAERDRDYYASLVVILDTEDLTNKEYN